MGEILAQKEPLLAIRKSALRGGQKRGQILHPAEPGNAGGEAGGIKIPDVQFPLATAPDAVAVKVTVDHAGVVHPGGQLGQGAQKFRPFVLVEPGGLESVPETEGGFLEKNISEGIVRAPYQEGLFHGDVQKDRPDRPAPQDPFPAEAGEKFFPKANPHRPGDDRHPPVGMVVNEEGRVPVPLEARHQRVAVPIPFFQKRREVTEEPARFAFLQKALSVVPNLHRLEIPVFLQGPAAAGASLGVVVAQKHVGHLAPDHVPVPAVVGLGGPGRHGEIPDIGFQKDHPQPVGNLFPQAVLQLRHILLQLHPRGEAPSRVLEIRNVPALFRGLPKQVAGVQIPVDDEGRMHAGNKLRQFLRALRGVRPLPFGAHLVVGHAAVYVFRHKPDFDLSAFQAKAQRPGLGNAQALFGHDLENVPFFLGSGKTPLPFQLLEERGELEKLDQIAAQAVNETMVAAAFQQLPGLRQRLLRSV